MENPDFKKIASSYDFTDESLAEFVERVWNMSAEFTKEKAEEEPEVVEFQPKAQIKMYQDFWTKIRLSKI